MGWIHDDDNGWDGGPPDAADLAREERIKAATPPPEVLAAARAKAREEWHRVFSAANAGWPFKPGEMLYEGKMPIRSRPEDRPHKYVWWRIFAQSPGHFAVRVISASSVEPARLWPAPKTTSAEAAEALLATARAWPGALWDKYTTPGDDDLTRPGASCVRALMNDIGIYRVPKDVPYVQGCYQVEVAAEQELFGKPHLWG